VRCGMSVVLGVSNGAYTTYWGMGLLGLCGAMQVMGVGYRGDSVRQGGVNSCAEVVIAQRLWVET
jgi:hypothetical protein